MPKPKNPTPFLLSLLALLLAPAPDAFGAERAGRGASRFSTPPHALSAANDREQDGLNGPVRRVKTETAKISVKNGRPVEGPRAVLETISYDNKGTRVDSAYFLTAGGTLTGKEVYKYDDRGNMVEMTLHNEDGSLQAKETYSYEFDSVGNWVKMTTSVAVIEGGKLTFEPTEVTYRTIAYYLEEAMIARMSQPAGSPAAATPPAPNATAPQPAPAKTAADAPPPAPESARTAANAAEQKSNAGATQAAARPADKAAGKVASKNGGKRGEKAPARNAPIAIPLVVAALDKNAAPAAELNVGQPAASGPVINADGEAPARPSARGPLKPVSGGILNGKARSLPQPTYPEMAKRARVMGTVEVEVVIDVSGKVISAKAVKGPVMLQQAAEQAARLAKFSPTLLSGQPVKVSGVINYNFNLQ
jgi:periplasmic protein TonB